MAGSRTRFTWRNGQKTEARVKTCHIRILIPTAQVQFSEGETKEVIGQAADINSMKLVKRALTEQLLGY